MTTLTDEDVLAVFKEKSINITQSRLQVCKLIYNECEPIFKSNSVLKVDRTINRISLHRTLKLFVKKDIIQTVPNTKGFVEYTLTAIQEK